MRRHRAGLPLALTIATIGLTLLALMAWAVSTPPVPTHRNRTASEWLFDLAGPDHSRKGPALEAFGAMGESAVPMLAKALEDRNSAIEQLMLMLMPRAPELGSWVVPAADRQSAALEALARIGTVSTLPPLIRFLQKPPKTPGTEDLLRATAAGIIGGLGSKAKAAIPALLDAVRVDAGRGSALCHAALTAVNRVGGSRAEIGPVLVECLRNPDERVRRLAAAGLGQWRENAAFAVEPLKGALWQPDDAAFTEVATALGQMGAAACKSAPDLIRGLSHENSTVRGVAALNLARVRPAPELALAPLIAALKDGDDFVRARAAWALGQFGAGAAPAAVELGRALQDDHEAVQIAVIEALGAIGPAAAGTVPDLELAGSNRQAGLGSYVRTALARIEKEPVVSRPW